MSFDDWLLALHVLSAFALVAGLVLFWVLIVAVRRTDTPDGTIRMAPVAKAGNAAVGLGMGGTIVFGIWLALSVGGYDIWDGWIIAALVLWILATAAGARTGKEYMAGMKKAEDLHAAGQTGPSTELLAINRTQRGVTMHALASLFTLLVLIDMIWKPGSSTLAAIRPDSWNFPLFIHVLGAMILVGGVLTAASMLAFARGDARLLRVGYWSLLFVALPGYVLMRIGGQWIYSKEGLDDAPIEAAWTGIGFAVADAGALLLLIALIVGGIGVRRLGAGKGTGLLKTTMAISVLLLAAYVVAIWAMTAKPD